MELLQLKYFCDAAETESFAKTAKKFYVPPSGISQSIRRLENELGVLLFSRQANRVVLNEEGRSFYLEVSKALRSISAAAEAIRDNGNGGKIKLCINTNRRFLLEVIEKYRKEYTGVEIEVRHFSNIDEEQFDIVIDSDSDGLTAYDKSLLISEKIMLAARADAFGEALQSADRRQLENLPFITMGKNSTLYDLTHRVCKKYGFKPHTVIQSEDPLYVQKCVELGLGVTLVPEFSWRGCFSEGIVMMEIEGFERKTYIYTNPKRYMPERVKKFVKILEDEAKSRAW